LRLAQLWKDNETSFGRRFRTAQLSRDTAEQFRQRDIQRQGKDQQRSQLDVYLAALDGNEAADGDAGAFRELLHCESCAFPQLINATSHYFLKRHKEKLQDHLQ